MRFDRELNRRLFQQREEGIPHAPIQMEMNFYELVSRGEMEKLQRLLKESPFDEGAGKGILSKNPTRNILYHFIVATAMITRFCIEGGMEPEIAYSLSDMYIQRADELNSKKELIELNYDMVMDYARRMRMKKKENLYSKHVVYSVNYIQNHLHEKFSVEELAVATGLTSHYFSKLFKKETGISVSDYIRKEKLEAAKNLLKYSEYSYLEIANYLSFSSQSHFIQVFKNQTGLTPKEFRNKYYQSTWNK